MEIIINKNRLLANTIYRNIITELGALVIYDRIKNFLTHVWTGGMSHFTKLMLKNSNTLYFVMKFIDIMI